MSESTFNKSINALLKKIPADYKEDVRDLYEYAAHHMMGLMRGGQSQTDNNNTKPEPNVAQVAQLAKSLEDKVKNTQVNNSDDEYALAQSAVTLQGALQKMHDMLGKTNLANNKQPEQPTNLNKIQKSLNRIQLTIDSIQSRLMLILKNNNML